MEITGLWVRTDADPDADISIYPDPGDRPQILRVMVEIKGEKQWRVIAEHRLASGNDLISHISEATAWNRKPIDPLTGTPDEATR